MGREFPDLGQLPADGDSEQGVAGKRSAATFASTGSFHAHRAPERSEIPSWLHHGLVPGQERDHPRGGRGGALSRPTGGAAEALALAIPGQTALDAAEAIPAAVGGDECRRIVGDVLGVIGAEGRDLGRPAFLRAAADSEVIAARTLRRQLRIAIGGIVQLEQTRSAEGARRAAMDADDVDRKERGSSAPGAIAAFAAVVIAAADEAGRRFRR